MVTIFDVAKEAGVSIKTVSRVMNFKSSVREETRARVLKVVENLEYRPNLSARSLAGSRSYLIGLLHDNPIPSYVTAVQMGAITVCRKAGYHLMVEPLDAALTDIEGQVAQMIATLRPEGLILTPPVSDNLAVLNRIERAGTPYVRIAPDIQIDRSAHVHMDDVRAAFVMTTYLLALGHREIGFIKGHHEHGATHLRYEGFMSAMQAAGRSVREDLIEQGDFSFRSGFDCAETLLSRPDRPTAIFSSNDEMALGVMAIAHRLGLFVPQDLSIAGFDDSPSASVVWPQLTTIRQPIFEMAVAASQMLLNGEAENAKGAKHASRILDFTLVTRESTTPPAASR